MTWFEMRQSFKEALVNIVELDKRLPNLRPIPQRSVHFMLNDLTDPDPGKRRYWSFYLSVIVAKDCSQDTLQRMLIGLNDSDIEVRRNISTAFAACGYTPAIDGLIRMLRNSDDEAHHAVDCLCAIGEKAVPALLNVMVSNQGPVTDAALEASRALSKMGVEVIDWILAALRDEGIDKWRNVEAGLMATLLDFPKEAANKLLAMQRNTRDSNPQLADKVEWVYKLLQYSLAEDKRRG